MGGKALDTPVERLDSARYQQITAELLPRLQTYYERVALPCVSPGKTSHGDVDILVCGPIAQRPLDPRIVLDSLEVSRNGPVCSFEYKRHQIDLISVPEDSFDMARFFYSYSDMGMIVGMMLASIGLKFGFKCLSVIVDSTQIVLSVDLTAVLQFLGLEMSVWEAGFSTETAIFDFIMSSRLFRHSMFRRSSQSDWNHGERKGLQNRPMFVNFVQYVNQRMPSTQVLKLLKEDIVSEAIMYFRKQPELDALREKIRIRNEIKQRFSGTIVMDITGLRGPELGAFMSECRASEELSDEKILSMTTDVVRQIVTEMWNNRAG